MKTFVKLAVAAAVLVPAQAFAVTGDIPFSGTVTDTCVISGITNGTLAPNAGYTVLGSKEAGGVAGGANILVTGGSFDVSLDAVTAFGAGSPATPSSPSFATEYDLSGVTTATDATAATTLNAGATAVSVDLTATLPSGTYSSGTYSATVVLRCE